MLKAESLSHAVIDVGGSSALASVRLRDAIRPDEDTVVVNLAGLKWGGFDDQLAANVLIPEVLAGALAPTGAHLVHVGSAAEYGPGEHGVIMPESRTCSPTSDYGVTKLQGTAVVMAAMPTATVLRPFNVVDADLPVRSPLSDVQERIERARSTGGQVDLISAATTRDYVSRAFVLESISVAVRLRPPGVFNICSGIGVSTGEIARMTLDDLGLANPIGAGDESLASSVVGDPARWFGRTGFAEALGCRGVVDILSRVNWSPT
jgi:nucleoside-diphosphate-sugar epimerase